MISNPIITYTCLHYGRISSAFYIYFPLVTQYTLFFKLKKGRFNNSAEQVYFLTLASLKIKVFFVYDGPSYANVSRLEVGTGAVDS